MNSLIHKKYRILFFFAAIVLIGITVFCLQNNRIVFHGDRIRNPDCYILQFDSMNQTDSHTLKLREGDILAVEFAIDRGRVDLSIGIAGKPALYTGNRIDNGIFDVIVPENGDYQITVNARHASGSIWIYANSGQNEYPSGSTGET